MRWIVGVQNVMGDKTPQPGEVISILGDQVTNGHGSADISRLQVTKRADIAPSETCEQQQLVPEMRRVRSTRIQETAKKPCLVFT